MCVVICVELVGHSLHVEDLEQSKLTMNGFASRFKKEFNAVKKPAQISLKRRYLVFGRVNGTNGMDI